MTASERNLGFADDLYDSMHDGSFLHCVNCGSWLPPEGHEFIEELGGSKALCPPCAHNDRYKELEDKHSQYIDQYNQEHGFV